MGAIIKDQGIESCKTWILQLFATRIDELHLDNWQKDPKTRLQELLQAKQLAIPTYTLVSQSGLPHEQTFKVECSIPLFDKNIIGVGISRKKAEQQAAELVLAKIARGN
jgi:ribonuclease-3